MTSARSMPAWLAVTGAVLVGVMTALQSRINGQLGAHLGDGVVTGLVSFGSGLLLVAIVSAVLPAGRRGVRDLARGLRAHQMPWWMLAGGIAGALTVTTQALTVGIIGVALFTVGLVAGQTVSGILLDRIGFSPAGVAAVTGPRLGGGVLALAAVAISLSGDAFSRVPPWMLLLPFVVGAGVAWQQATNGRLRQRTGSALITTLVSFTSGTVVLLLASTVSVAVGGMPRPFPADPWLYLGGLLGAVYIALSAVLAPRIGVLLLGLGSVLGLLGASVVLDAVWPPAAPAAVWQSITTVIVAFLSVAVVAVPWRRR